VAFDREVREIKGEQAVFNREIRRSGGRLVFHREVREIRRTVTLQQGDQGDQEDG
jgi:hypothetical protein